MGNPHPPTDQHLAPGHHEAVEVDPEHDIDGRMSAVLIVVGALVFFFCFWLLLPIFDEVMTRERDRKINNRPNAELQELVTSERAFLRGEEGKSKKTIEQVMAELPK